MIILEFTLDEKSLIYEISNDFISTIDNGYNLIFFLNDGDVQLVRKKIDIITRDYDRCVAVVKDGTRILVKWGINSEVLSGLRTHGIIGVLVKNPARLYLSAFESCSRVSIKDLRIFLNNHITKALHTIELEEVGDDKYIEKLIGKALVDIDKFGLVLTSLQVKEHIFKGEGNEYSEYNK